MEHVPASTARANPTCSVEASEPDWPQRSAPWLVVPQPDTARVVAGLFATYVFHSVVGWEGGVWCGVSVLWVV